MRWWQFLDPQRVVEYRENGAMMKDARVRLWAKRLAAIHDRAARHEFLMHVPEEFRDAVEFLARTKK